MASKSSMAINRTQLTVQGEQQTVTLCQCLRCGNIWKPRKPSPARCPSCLSPLWNKERKYQLKGKEAPTQPIEGRRGKPFAAGYDPRRDSQPNEPPSQNNKAA
jgi:DNA-directed RNA polymerase subunit RPC12/RpoP